MRKVCGVLVMILICTIAEARADEFYTKSRFDPENPLIVKIASQFEGNNDLEIAENVWDWMRENIEYELHGGGGEDLVETIEKGKGNCASQAYLAASLLIAASFPVENARIGEGKTGTKNGHAWVEILTDRWHRFDTCYTSYHSFEMEYSLPIPEDEKEFTRLDYYYYDTRKTGEIVLKDSSISLFSDIHLIELIFENTGEITKVVNIEIKTDLEVIGNSHNFQVTIQPGQTVTDKTYLKGEGHVRLIISEIVYEAYLFYPEQETSAEQVQEDSEQPLVEPQSVQQPVQQTVKPKDITSEIQTKGTEKTIKKTVTKSENFPTWSLSFLLLIPLFCVVLKKA